MDYIPDEFDEVEDLERWALRNSDAIIDSIDNIEEFSDLLIAVVYVKSARKAARRFEGDGLPFPRFLRMTFENDLKAFAGREEYETSAERALALLESEAVR